MSRKKWFYLVVVVASIAGLLASGCGAAPVDGGVTDGDGGVTDGDGAAGPVEYVTMNADYYHPDRIERKYIKGTWVEGMKPGEEDIYYDIRQGGTGSAPSPYITFGFPLLTYGPRWEDATQGHIKMWPGYGYLYSKIPESIDLVGAGVIEMGWCSSAYRPDRLPYGLLPGIGFWHDGLDYPERVMMIHYNALHPLYHDWMRNLGLQSMSTTSGGWTYGFWITAKGGMMLTKDDFKGKLSRATSYLPALFEDFGITPLLLTHPEYIEALQKGMIDMGVGWRIEPGTSYSWLPEILTHVGVFPSGINDWTGQRFMNAALWDGMPQYMKDIYTEVLYPEAIVVQALGERMAHRNYELDWEEQGTIFYEIPPETVAEFVKSGAYAFNMFVTDLRARGVDVDTEIRDTLRFRRLLGAVPWSMLPTLEEEYGLTWDWETGMPAEPPAPWPSVQELLDLYDQINTGVLPPGTIPWLEGMGSTLLPGNIFMPDKRADFARVFD